MWPSDRDYPDDKPKIEALRPHIQDGTENRTVSYFFSVYIYIPFASPHRPSFSLSARPVTRFLLSPCQEGEGTYYVPGTTYGVAPSPNLEKFLIITSDLGCLSDG